MHINGDLHSVIPDAFRSFSFSKYYEDEKKVLQPALEKLGYTKISFHMGERDSFGPLSRYAVCWKDGRRYELMYG